MRFGCMDATGKQACDDLGSWLLCRAGIPRDNLVHEKGRAGSEKGHDSSLHLQEAEVPEDDRAAFGGDVEVTHVRRGAQSRGKVHLKVALEIQDYGNDHDEFVNAIHGFPVLKVRQSCMQEDAGGTSPTRCPGSRR